MSMKIEKPYTLTKDDILKKLGVIIDSGLSDDEVSKRRAEYGENVLEAKEKVSALKIFLHNANNIIVYLLILASGVSFAMDEPVEGFAVIVAILIAVLSGFISEYKAQKSVESLQKMTKTVAKVRRNGKITEIESQHLVLGDVLYIEEGDLITADSRIIEDKNFAVIESALTGESESMDKTSDFVGEEDTSIGDRKNMVFTGTAATRGNTYAVVTATGMDTEIGKISDMIRTDEETVTPLEEQLNRLGKTLILFSAVVAFAVTLLGISYGEDLYAMIKIGIILAIAAVPEALPAVSTITLAIGMKTMASHNALVKSLPAVETLGSTTVICTDKTGTLTENQMTVKHIYHTSLNRTFEVEGDGYDPDAAIVDYDQALEELIVAGVLCSNASLVKEENDYKIIGDPTEGGIVVLGEKASLTKEELENKGYNRVGEVPFNSKDKYMVTAYDMKDDEKRLFIKGAPEVLMKMAKAEEKDLNQWNKVNEDMTHEGMRVLAIAQIKNYQGDIDEASMIKALKQGIEILGFVGIIDPPREDVKEAIQVAQEAGIRVIMITGDHPGTASIIAQKIGMKNIDKVITGKEMDLMSDEALAEEIKTTSVFARVSPENKLQIVRALNLDDEVTAMTGDGVNDAPALNGADIGIAMGIRGTEVAKEASDMILTDDRFSTIVDAVKEGRVIFDNMEKFIYFLFSCNLVEILAIFLSILFKLPIPILALQILWLNLVVDVLPAMSFAWETGEGDIMKRMPRDPKQAIVNKDFLIKISASGILLGVGSLTVFAYSLSQGYDLDTARTIAFATMAFSQLFHVLNVRKKDTFGLDKSILKNPFLIGALVIAASLMLLVIYLPFFNEVMYTKPLDAYKWWIILLGSFVPTLIIQSYGAVKRGLKHRIS
ncbi:MAG: HAD-IC family P-type ATPase [Vallitaleaceae bacterium]|nr:HAD-IC family P-type ATPase [Vallitaleaceae bacterium]